MTVAFYEKISKPFRSPRAKKGLRLINSCLTTAIFCSYLGLLLFLFFTNDARLFRMIYVPATAFAVVCLVRIGINAPRPYEVLEIHPIIEKKKRGQSMPSRHTFSAFIIAMAWCYFIPWTSIFCFLAGALLGTTRVIAGIHFPSDVIVGALLGVLCGVIGFFFL